MFVLVTVGIHDGLQTSFTSKFTYGLWRPVTAIRRAAEDLNAATDPDATWTPLLTTPPYPSYAGNAACIGAAGARVLEVLRKARHNTIVVKHIQTLEEIRNKAFADTQWEQMLKFLLPTPEPFR